ncbi:TetR/AcrR family transcriptional regulator [Nocardia sp. NPDC051030]|uniref:TetR/AcrR family transcriptional regulator n=1 Tax=Nocardia sp. NPDC051030 TaxID=3155162 RepID=UPI0034326797
MTTTSDDAEPKGMWLGTTKDERRQSRRTGLLEAALEIVGAEGSAAVTVRSVCRQSSLTARYFYENFANREELLAELYRQLAAEAQITLTESLRNSGGEPAAQARATVEAFVSFALDDPRKGRMLLVEPLRDPELSALTILTTPTFTKLAMGHLPPGTTRTKQALIATSLAGSLGIVFAAWLSGNIKASREELVDHCTELLLVAGLGSRVLTD